MADADTAPRLDEPVPFTTSARPLGRLGRRAAEDRLALNDLVASHQVLLDHMVGLARLHQAVRNLLIEQRQEVLWSGLAVLDQSGIWAKTEGQMGQSIFVVNLTAQTITVAGMPRQSAAPISGAGVHQVPTNCAMTLNLRASAWSIYGPANGLVDVQIFARPQAPFASTV